MIGHFLARQAVKPGNDASLCPQPNDSLWNRSRNTRKMKMEGYQISRIQRRAKDSNLLMSFEDSPVNFFVRNWNIFLEIEMLERR